jgi:hypothetical protein
MKRTAVLIALCGACMLGSFFVTLIAAPPNQADSPGNASLIPEKDWARACAVDTAFAGESRELRQRADEDRGRLAELLSDQNAGDEVILAQVEKVIASHDQLERRVAQHLLKIRKQLTPDQQKQLMGLASDSVRQGGYRWRGGRGPSSVPATQPTDHRGRKGKAWQRE